MLPLAHVGHYLWVFYLIPVFIVIGGILYSTIAGREEKLPGDEEGSAEIRGDSAASPSAGGDSAASPPAGGDSAASPSAGAGPPGG